MTFGSKVKARNSHKKYIILLNNQPIPFLNSPFGPLGQLRSLTMSFGTKFLDLYSYLVSTRKMSPAFATILLMGLFVTVGVFVIIAVGLMLSKEKIE